jgi:hypothetical protein
MTAIGEGSERRARAIAGARPIRAVLAACFVLAAAIAIPALLAAGVPLRPALAAGGSDGPPPGSARIWFYRDYQPYVTLARPYVRFNDRIVGISEPGGAFYRDVAPGHYEITVDSDAHDVNQFARVTAAAGQQLFVEVDALRDAHCAVGGRGSGCRPTFYTRLRPPEIAASAIANSTFHGGK